MPDAAAQLRHGGVEAGRVAGRDGIGDGPVHGGLLAEFLAGQVADGDDEVAVLPDVVDVAGPQSPHGQVVATGGGDRAGVDLLCRVGSG